MLRGGGRRGAPSLGTASRVHTKADRHTKATVLAALPVLSTEPIIRDVPLQMSGEVGVNMGSQSFLTHPPSGLALICMQAPGTGQNRRAAPAPTAAAEAAGPRGERGESLRCAGTGRSAPTMAHEASALELMRKHAAHILQVGALLPLNHAHPAPCGMLRRTSDNGNRVKTVYLQLV